jgi:hypothetical protein
VTHVSSLWGLSLVAAALSPEIESISFSPPDAERSRSAPHCPVTQRWARALVDAYLDQYGVRYNSRFAGHLCAALFPCAGTVLPDRSVASLPLTHPAQVTRLAGAGRRLGCTGLTPIG